MNNQPTSLKKIHIKNFRNLQDIEVEFGTRITVISGKNGTAKSTILGLAAQIFSFTKDYTTNTDLNYRTLNGQKFKSEFKEHFRLSEKYDKPGEMDISYCVYDAYEKQDIDTLMLRLTDTEGRKHRAVVRNNIKTKYSENTSRNITHPVIYLNLKRLYPIAEREEATVDIDYLKNNAKEFTKVCSTIVGKENHIITSTQGKVVNSSVTHGNNYDHESVSSGEDNVGQIVQALFSFKKLSEEYPNYHGGLLIIDEIDAGLFPFAQAKIMQQLQYFAHDYNIQIIVTSHSPIIIEEIFDKSQKDPKQFKNIFLSQAHGKLEIKNNYQWSDIYADLFITTKVKSSDMVLPKVNIYAEDDEAFDFFSRLITSKNLTNIINRIREVSLGCKDYHALISKKIPEFTQKSIIVFDGDESKAERQKHQKTFQKQHNLITLPTIQPPDRLLFRFLFELPDNDSFWHNNLGFTKYVFKNCTNSQSIISRLALTNNNIQNFDNIVQQDLDNPNTNGLRELFKGFYKDKDIQKLLKNKNTCPFAYYIKKNPEQKQEFEKKFIECLKYVLQHGFGEPKSKIETYFNGQT